MEKTRDLFKKIQRYQGNISCKDGHNTAQKLYGPKKIPYDYTVEVRKRFKGLDLIDRVPEELWTEVCDIVQEAVIKTIPKKKEMQKVKMVA